MTSEEKVTFVLELLELLLELLESQYFQFISTDFTKENIGS